ncbi:TonB-dependent receptor [Alloalcanivorax xenomutans]|uniref:TonB-dependent receptor n=1 Tax=Alloalcanivorax xenomutans TaxID=1094342 RepID=UPI003D9BA749
MRPLRFGVPVSLLSLTLAPLAMAENDPHKLDAVTVTASRSQGEVGKTPQKVTVITRQELEDQLAITGDQAQVLSNLIPGYAPSRQKLSNAGESFRGRNPLFLVDGVPQSNPLRDGSRDGYTIDLSMVERIEVIHGASAEHGLGATGGIINFVTRRPEGDRVRQHAGVSVSAPTDYESDGLGYKADYRVEGLHGKWDYLAGVTYQSRGLFYDANGDAIGVDNTQGDIMDSESHDVMVKVGYWFDDNQNLQLTVNRFFLEGNHDYVIENGVRRNRTPTTSEKGDPEGKPTRNEVLTTSLNYHNLDLAGNDLQLQLYTQRFRARYGGGTFDTFQVDPEALGEDRIYDQSQNESDKVGGKITLNRDGLFNGRVKLTTGLDVLQDETSQVLVHTDREWVPETRFQNIAPFLQGEWRVTDRLTAQAGVRYEYAKLDVDDFTTLAYYGDDHKQGNRVVGGDPSFDETLLNGGLTYQITEGLQLFANYSEGFGMPDVGRVLRAIGDDGARVDDFLDLRPIVTDNREVGIRINQHPVTFEASYFESDSDLGARLADNGSGFFEVKREKTEINGVEAQVGWQVEENHHLSASYAHTSGKYDGDDDGHLESRLDARNIAPDRVTLRWQARWTSRLRSQVQGSHYFSRHFDDDNTNFDGYNLVDLSLVYQLPKGQLSGGIENLFNEDYFTYYSQSATNREDQYFKGRGRVITVGYSLDF